MRKKRKTISKKGRRAPSKSKWLTVCPNCGYRPKGTQFGRKQPHRFRCPICFYHGPAIQVKAQDYSHTEFEHQRIPDKHEGKLIWPEIILILILSALATVLLWKAARGVL